MFTTGSKLLIGATVVATIATVVYGTLSGGSLGTIGLASLAASLALLSGIVIFIRDANVSADIDQQLLPAAAQAPSMSPWPLVSAIGLAAVAVGLVTYPAVVILGLVVVLAGSVEWMVQAWSDRSSASTEYNAEIRTRIVGPVEVPVMAALAAALVVYGFSRVMLTVSKTTSIVAFGVAAIVVLAIASMFVRRERTPGRTIIAAVSAGVAVLVVGGAVSALNGERSMHVIETTSDLGFQGRCGPEASEADELYSQTVGAKANQAATVTLGADEVLRVSVPGFNASESRVTLHRANPNNVLFRNDSDHERRLAIDIESSDADVGTRTVCTALVEPGGVQLMTLYFDRPSVAVSEGYRFEVPGVDGATVEVIVP
jgi:hypothetical protein